MISGEQSSSYPMIVSSWIGWRKKSLSMSRMAGCVCIWAAIQLTRPSWRPPAKKQKLTMAEEKEYAEIEAVIASKEGELKVVELQMAECAADYGRLNELTKEQQRLSGELDQLMDRWAYLEEFSS